DEKLGGKVLSTSDPNRKLVLRDDGTMESVRLPETDIVPGTERFVDPDTGNSVKPEDLRVAEYNSLLGKKAIETEKGSGKYFTLNDDNTVSVTEITNTIELGPKYKIPNTDKEISDSDFDSQKVFNKDLNTEAVDLGDGKYLVRDQDDGDLKVATLKEVQERPKTITDKETGESITEKDFDSKAVDNPELGKKVVDLGNERYFYKDDDGEIKVLQREEVQVRDEKIIDPETKSEITKEQFETMKYRNDELGKDVVDSGDNRYFYKDDDGEIKVVQREEVQERPKTITDKETGESITEKDFDSKAVDNPELGKKVVDLGNERYFYKDDDGEIKVLQREEVQERPESVKDPVTGREIETENFDIQKRYNVDLGKEAVETEAGSGRYFVKDESGQIKIVTIEKTETKIDHILDPKTRKEITKEQLETANFNSELGEKGVKIEDGRYFKLNEDGEIVIKEFVAEPKDVVFDQTLNRKVSPEDIKNAPLNDQIGEKALKIDDNTYYVLNADGQVEKAEIKTVEKKEFEIVGDNFNKKLTEADYNTLQENPELKGKVVDLGNDKLLVMKEDGNGYITNRKKLEAKVATETVNTLINDAISRNDANRLKEIIAQSKDNTKLPEQMRKDLKALNQGGLDKKLSNKDFIDRVQKYNQAKDSEGNYLDEKTGRIFNLNTDKFKKKKRQIKKLNIRLTLKRKLKLIKKQEKLS
ncbi:MAG: hypothetical protein Q7K48_07440, partial [Fusobacterium sp. JB021]|nr:hypothetical protein [Fusobacterium sp. JB021]